MLHAIRNALTRPAVLAVTSVLTACAHSPPATVELPAVVPRAQRTWEEPAVLATWRALGGEGAHPIAELDATETLAASLNFNPQLALAQAQADAGRAGVLFARQRPNPILSLTPEHAINAVAGVSPWVAALSLVWPMQTGGKRALAIEQALAASDASLLNAADLVWNLRASARTALCTAEYAAAKNELVHEESVLRADLAGRLDKQADAGVASRYDAARAHLEGDNAAQRARQSATDLIAAKHDLAAVAGMPFAAVEVRLLGQGCLAAQPRASVADLSVDAEAAAIASRLDLRAKLAEFRSADAAWRAELARRKPDLNLGPGYTYDQGTRKITFTLSAELPVFSHNAGGIAKARADRDRVQAQIEVLQESIVNAVARARDQLSAVQSQYAASVSAAEQTEQLLRRDIDRQASGEIDQPAVIVGRIAAVTARIDVLNCQRAVADAIGALETATQAPLETPFFDGAAAQAMLVPPEASRSP
jgi:cobalt-zinc-cadmium efflux system outer membrane protein